MPVYNTVTAAAVLDVTPKWLDNLLSHNNIDGLTSDSQGVSRRLSTATIIVLTLAKELIDALQLPAAAAIGLATRILDNPSGECSISPNLRITLQADLLRANVLSRLAYAVEMAPTPRRGRPPKR